MSRLRCSSAGPGAQAGCGPVNGIPNNSLARNICIPPISLSVSQPGGAGAPIYVSNTNLTVGKEYFNLFSLDLCSAGLGSGPLAGLCLNTFGNVVFMAAQLSSPLGTPGLHFAAPSSYVLSGPFSLPPLTLEATCFEWTGSALGSTSVPITLTVQ